jgi:hypothetical protein
MAEIVRRTKPHYSAAYFANPHRGCCTFQHFNGDELFPGTGWSEEGPIVFPPAKTAVIDGYLPTTVAYCRWFWRAMEPEKGKFDFSMIDRSLEVCKERGQTLAVRIMAFGSAKQPQVPDWYARIAPMQKIEHKSLQVLQPVHDAPEYLEHWGGFVREFARRYDNNPLLESIDVTYIGPWGEGAGECSTQQCRKFAEVWKDAFANTPRLGLIGGEQMRIAVESGAGWRCDCFGDMSETGSPLVQKRNSWNHMYECYPRGVVMNGGSDTWKTAPVHFETCWVPMTWYQRNFDLDFILEQGLKYHGTYFMPKYTRLPEKWMDKLEAFCNKLGYRYAYRLAVIDATAKIGGSFHFTSWIENVGVAPIYRKYDFAVRLRQGDHEEIIALPEIDIRKWLPGDAWIERPLKLSDKLQRGWADISAALVDPATKEARISFAIEEQYSDRWVPLGGIEIV